MKAMKIDKSALSEKLITLANAANESAVRLNLVSNNTFYGRICEFAESMRTPYPDFAAIIRIEQREVDGYHIIERIMVKDMHCFLIGDAQAGLIIQKISENQDVGSVKDGESDG